MSIQPGVKISINGTIGTLGLVVTKQNDLGKIYILSCWHVLDNGHRRGVVTLPELDNIPIADYRRSGDTASKRLDAAIAEIKPGLDMTISNRIFGQERVIKRVAAVNSLMSLNKVGAITGRTRAKVFRVTSDYNYIYRAIRLKKHDQGLRNYCQPGDSGAIWCNIPSGHAVGMHAQGGFGDNSAAASRVKLILKELNLKIL